MLKDFLSKGKVFKLICGATNNDTEQIEALIKIFSLAGCKFFDVSCTKEAIKAAKKGVLGTKNAYICASVGLGDDKHLKKAKINEKNCRKCKKCKEICPQNAIKNEKINQEKCVGCRMCQTVCPSGCIFFENANFDIKQAIEIAKEENIDCFELHCSIKDKSSIIKAFEEINEQFDKIISISIDRSKLGDDEILELLSEFVKSREPYTTIIQAEGCPITGGENTAKATLQTVAFAELIYRQQLPAYIFLSGGVNEKSFSVAKACEIEICGISMGSYARKFVKEFLHRDFLKDSKMMEKAVKTAQNLVKSAFFDKIKDGLK